MKDMVGSVFWKPMDRCEQERNMIGPTCDGKGRRGRDMEGSGAVSEGTLVESRLQEIKTQGYVAVF